MSSPLFTPQELIVLEATYRKLTRDSGKTMLSGAMAALQFLGLATVVVVEYSLLFEVFNYLKGPSSGGDGQWSVPLLALTGAIMLLAFHLYAKQFPNATAVNVLHRCIDLLLPLYVIGAGAALAAIIYFDGADALIASVSESSRELFQDNASSSGSHAFESVLSLAPAAFALGCSGLAVINLFVSHRLATLLWSNVQDIEQRTSCAREAHAAMSEIRSCLQQYPVVQRERAELSSSESGEEDLADANRILGVIRQSLSPYETWITDQKVRAREPVSPFLGSQGSLDLKEMQQRIAAIKAITVKSILSAMRGAKE